MDKTRLTFIKTLKDADHHGRLQVYSPVTTLGLTIIVHAKLTIIDDVLLRIGSANINNRSLGFDTECDLSLEAVSPENRAEVTRLRNKLLAHWLGCLPEPLDEAIAKHGSVGQALEHLRTAGYARLRPITPKPLRPLAAFISAFHIGDPIGPEDSWRPWRRKRAATAEAGVARRLAAQIS
jgi:phosphatidylserine/phosphatidylglycerophosphate/cardiolipin synthase-like enzyme